jgi:TolA-binding protein
MKKLLPLCILAFFAANILTAQNKKELQAELDRLNTELAEKENEILEARKTERISVAKAAEFESQVAELQEANATLLNNLKIFTESTKQRSESIGQTLSSLRDKEAKLKVINDEFSKNDSIALLVITGFKQTLGENARVGVKEGAIVVELDKAMLFGGSSAAEVSEDGKSFLSKIADVLNANKDTEAVVVGQLDSIADPKTTYSRSLSILKQLNKVATDRVFVSHTAGSVENYEIRIHPKLNSFYLKVRETIKNNK